jgi:hypothetical protein
MIEKRRTATDPLPQLRFGQFRKRLTGFAERLRIEAVEFTRHWGRWCVLSVFDVSIQGLDITFRQKRKPKLQKKCWWVNLGTHPMDSPARCFCIVLGESVVEGDCGTGLGG